MKICLNTSNWCLNSHSYLILSVRLKTFPSINIDPIFVCTVDLIDFGLWWARPYHILYFSSLALSTWSYHIAYANLVPSLQAYDPLFLPVVAEKVNAQLLLDFDAFRVALKRCHTYYRRCLCAFSPLRHDPYPVFIILAGQGLSQN